MCGCVCLCVCMCVCACVYVLSKGSARVLCWKDLQEPVVKMHLDISLQLVHVLQHRIDKADVAASRLS